MRRFTIGWALGLLVGVGLSLLVTWIFSPSTEVSFVVGMILGFTCSMVGGVLVNG